MEVLAAEGESLMQIAKAAGLPSIEGVCGGKLEVRLAQTIQRFVADLSQCATCHVYLPRRPKDGAIAPVRSMTEAEDDMLEYAIGRRDDSRLGCQIPVTKQLVQWLDEGGAINLPKF